MNTEVRKLILQEQNILFFPRTMGQGGTENVVLQLCEILQLLVNKIVVCSCGGVNVKRLEGMGIKHYLIPDIQAKSPQTVLSTYLKVRKIMQSENITVVHTHHRMAAFYTTLLSYTKRFTFINTSHNTFYDKKRFARFTFSKANMIACGEMVKRNLVKFYGISETQVKVIHNVVKSFDGKAIPVDEMIAWKRKGYYVIGNIGRLSEQKGFDYFIDAISMILAEVNNCVFFIIGDGDDKQKLSELVKQKHLEESCFFLGYRKDVQNVMSQLDLVTQSSLWEGLPLTPIEAFSVGKTVVATAVDGTVEIVKDRENGLLIEPKNPRQIAGAVIEIINNAALRAELEKNAKQTFETEFSYEQYKAKVIDYYESLGD